VASGWQQLRPSEYTASASISVRDDDIYQAADIAAGVLRSRVLVSSALRTTGVRVDSAAVDAAVASIAVTPVPATTLLNISVSAATPQAAAAVANALGGAYADYANTGIRARVAGALERALAEHAARVDAVARAEETLRAHLRDATPPQTVAVVVSRLKAQLPAAAEHRRLLENAWRQITAVVDPLDSRPVAGEALVQELRAQLIRLRQTRLDLSLTYGERHPLVQTADADVVAMEGSIAHAARLTVEQFRRDLAAAIAAHEQLQEQLAIAEAQYAALGREAELVDTLVARVERERKAEVEAAAQVRRLREQQVTASAGVYLVERAL
jgi:uncharacterized protein involved in exopolysaccharide biosynthesis